MLASAFRSGASAAHRRALSTVSGARAWEVIDSRGNPTVEVELTTSDGGAFSASVPSGASTGAHEAVELRDGGDRYMGKGVLKACANVNDVIAPAIAGHDVTAQTALDELMIELDGTPNKATLGANAILGVSLAAAKAGAAAKGVPLYQHFAELGDYAHETYSFPTPSFNVINGGSHAGNRLAFQEFMILPTGADTFSHAMQIGCEVYHTLKSVITDKYGQDAVNVGDEGGFAPNIQDNTEGVELLMTAIERAGYADRVEIGMDVASSEFYDREADMYDLNFKYKHESGSELLTGEELGELYKGLCDKFPIISIEDPFDEDDWASYSRFTADMGERIQVVGDDLLVTNPARITIAQEKQACNALLLKVNQIGSVTESIRAVQQCHGAGWNVMTSHRSGETEDHYIADLAVGLTTEQIKTGAPCRSERTAKYNQLLRIEAQVGDKARYGAARA